MNVGGKLVDDRSCDAILNTAGNMDSDWAVLFLAECDAHLNASHQLNFDHHFSRRFWDGPGSRPFCIRIRDSVTCYLRSVDQQGRACRVHLADGLDMNICYIFAHAGHGDELFKSLSDIAFLIRTRPRNSNTVLLPRRSECRSPSNFP